MKKHLGVSPSKPQVSHQHPVGFSPGTKMHLSAGLPMHFSGGHSSRGSLQNFAPHQHFLMGSIFWQPHQAGGSLLMYWQVSNSLQATPS
jgi:hypothetical protein